MNTDQKIEALTQAIIDRALAGTPKQATEPPPCRWDPSDLWHGIPEEFHAAELSPSLHKALSTKPVSVALVGPPGVGKTRALWAMVHAIRQKKMEGLIWQAIDQCSVHFDGETIPRRESVAEAITRQLKKIDRLRIITEVGDIRRNRYDYSWLSVMSAEPFWLAVDDIGAIEPNEWVRESIYALANERRAHKRTTVWTTNKTPGQLRDTFGGAIASRLLGGVVIETTGEDWRMK